VQIQIFGGLREGGFDGVGSVVPPRMSAVSLPDSGSSADSRVSSAWAVGLINALAAPTIMPLTTVTFASNLYPFTVKPGSKEFLI
jgi:hypothetical protein